MRTNPTVRIGRALEFTPRNPVCASKKHSPFVSPHRGWNNIFPPPAMMSDELLWHCSRCQSKVFSDFLDDTDEVSAELCQNTR